MSASTPKPLDEIAAFYENNACVEAYQFRALPADATTAQKVAAMREVIEWYDRHTQWIVQQVLSDLRGVERAEGLEE